MNIQKEWQPVIIITIIAIPLIFSILYVNHLRILRILRIDNDECSSKGTVEKVLLSQPKGKTTRRDVVYYNFKISDSIIHDIEFISEGGARNIKKGDMVNIQYECTDYWNNNLIFIADRNANHVNVKNKYLVHIYKSKRHERLINNR